MHTRLVFGCAVGLLLSAGLARVRAEDQPTGEMIVNPIYKHWSAFQPGTSVTRREKVKFPAHTEEAQRYHDGTLIKDITTKLLTVTPEKVVVEVIEAEHGRGSLQESAPFKITYFAHIKKGLGTPKESFTHHKQEDVEVQAHGKTYKATLVETTQKTGPVTRSQKVWLSDEVPGGIVKEEKIQKHGNEVISESTLEILQMHKPA